MIAQDFPARIEACFDAQAVDDSLQVLKGVGLVKLEKTPETRPEVKKQ